MGILCSLAEHQHLRLGRVLAGAGCARPWPAGCTIHGHPSRRQRGRGSVRRVGGIEWYGAGSCQQQLAARSVVLPRQGGDGQQRGRQLGLCARGSAVASGAASATFWAANSRLHN